MSDRGIPDRPLLTDIVAGLGGLRLDFRHASELNLLVCGPAGQSWTPSDVMLPHQLSLADARRIADGRDLIVQFCRSRDRVTLSATQLDALCEEGRRAVDQDPRVQRLLQFVRELAETTEGSDRTVAGISAQASKVLDQVQP